MSLRKHLPPLGRVWVLCFWNVEPGGEACPLTIRASTNAAHLGKKRQWERSPGREAGGSDSSPSSFMLCFAWMRLSVRRCRRKGRRIRQLQEVQQAVWGEDGALDLGNSACKMRRNPSLIKPPVTRVLGQRPLDPLWLGAWKPRRNLTGRALV